MSAWSDGYFTDVQYTRKFFPQLAPGLIAFACLRQGIRPPELGPGSTYLELGCGQGFSLNMLAAANPTMQFWGVDFHPGQIANAQRLARTGGLSNVTFEDLSFAQVLDQPEGRIPRCDVIALHGVLSWISPENRAHVVRILDRHLKPGGLVMASYNVLPGWAQFMPVRHLAKARFDNTIGPPKTRAIEAFRFIKDLIARDARGLATPQVKAQVEEALKADPSYLIHEYLNDHFHPLYHADLARELQGARLTFAASINLADDLVATAAPQPLQGLIQTETDSAWRETLLDYANGRRFRIDVFARGPNPLSPGQREALLAPMRFSLLRPPGQVNYNFKIPIGSMKADLEVYAPLVEALAEGPRSYGDLARLPPFANGQEGLLLKALGMLIGNAVTHPPAPDEAVDVVQSQRFNRSFLEGLTLENAPPHLAAPAIGTGVGVTLTDLLALSVVGEKAPDHQGLARRSWELMAPSGSRFIKDGKTLADRSEHEAEAVARMKAFETEKLPIFRSLGVI